MSAHHTPGPWATDGNEKSWSLLDSDGRRIALIDKGGLNAAPNARLITAAPDLLEALHVALGALEFEGVCGGDCNACDMARAAIAKAVQS